MTSSVAAAALGLHPYNGPQTAQALILGDEIASSEGNTKAIERGDRLEAACLDCATARTGVFWTPAPFVAHANGWSADSPDALFESEDGSSIEAIGEAKTVSGRLADKWGEEGTDEVPDHVLVQCCWHLYHWPSAPRVWVPVLMAGWEFEFRLYVVERNDILIHSLVADAHAWYERHILRREPVVPNEKDERIVRARWPRALAPVRELTDEMRELARAKTQLAKQRQAIEAEEARVATRLRDLMGPAGYASDDGLSITYRDRKTRRVDWRAAQKALGITPEQLEPFTTVGHSRALTVNVRS